MSKANEVMTRSLAICSPDDTATHIASIMRDRDIGDVLVMQDGKLQGIVTDRDLAIHALGNGTDPTHITARSLMSDDLITGCSDWSMRRVAHTMAKHQIRRLPIMDDGQVVGIISLGDLAKYENRKSIVSSSLKSISADPIQSKSNGMVQTRALIGLGLVALTSTAIALLTWNRSGRDWSKQMADTRFYQNAQEAVSAARDRMGEAVESPTAKNFRHQIRSNMKQLSYQLPRIEYKPPRRKSAWMRYVRS